MRWCHSSDAGANQTMFSSNKPSEIPNPFQRKGQAQLSDIYSAACEIRTYRCTITPSVGAFLAGTSFKITPIIRPKHDTS